MQPRPGDADIEQPALLLDLFVGLRIGDRHHAVGEPHEEHRVPLQALGGVQRGQGDALDGGGVLGGLAFVQFHREFGQAGARAGAGEVLGEPDERGHGFPLVAHGAGSGGRLGRPAGGAEHGPDLGPELDDVVQEGIVAAGAGGPAQGEDRLLDLGPLEEPLGSAQLVGHSGVGEGLFVDLGLGVDPVEHGDLARGDARRDEVPDPPGDALGLGGLVRVLGVDRVGADLALGDQLQPVFGGAALGLVQQAVGEVHHLGVER